MTIADHVGLCREHDVMAFPTMSNGQAWRPENVDQKSSLSLWPLQAIDWHPSSLH